MVPILLNFVLVATMIGWVTTREVEEKPVLSDEEKEAEKARRAELKKKRAEAKEARKEREKARKKRKDAHEPDDEWDRALEETYKT